MSAKKELFWKVSVIVMAVAVCVQAVVFYRLLSRIDDKTGKTDEKEAEAFTLKPRQINPFQYQQQHSVPSNQHQQFAPPPIPKLNVNVNNMPGVKPSITAQQQKQQYPQHGLSSSSGMNINISQSPFVMDIKEEMAKMEQMMNAMMNRNGAGMRRMRSSSRSSLLGGRITSPAISADTGNYVVTVNIPGLDKSQISAEVNGNMLTISGVQREETDISNRCRICEKHNQSIDTYTLPRSGWHSIF